MIFAITATTTAIAAFLLGIGWVFAGSLLLKRWGITAGADGLIVGRRIGAAYLGISMMMFLARSEPPSDLRDAVSIAMLFVMIALAILGTLEFMAKRVNASMLISVVLEIILAIGFAWSLIS